ncbi:DUF4198 domain-containing protein [Aporhodopirellula aestuarii]|uniref:DUF4198 domain-containing protein n=1 Tax=Aporhodopirellula aestuarii TaxID=2950107 RepID=A0ABT0U5G0_9BACT|nr:DUF4198 domain-containing protein [Aporhodopirellula aestuarii]MCM2372149.1 DUF4198 domain-containing protein [Aporhodopirellula aestuarii]
MNRNLVYLMPAIFLFLQPPGNAHDLWTQSNSAQVRTGEVVHVDLCLGNHGNHHRDFKLAGRISLDWIHSELISPDGTRVDLREGMTSNASAETEGCWTRPVIAELPGVYCATMTLDRVMNHGKSVRGVRTAKTYFLASDSLDRAKVPQHAHEQPLGMPFELVLKTCPFTQTQVGSPIRVQVLHRGEPMSDVVVSFIPQGTQLADEFDPEYESRTDSDGMATFVPKSGNRYLVVAHYTADDEKTDAYESTSYAATITLHVPVTSPLASR